MSTSFTGGADIPVFGVWRVIKRNPWMAIEARRAKAPFILSDAPRWWHKKVGPEARPFAVKAINDIFTEIQKVFKGRALTDRIAATEHIMEHLDSAVVEAAGEILPALKPVFIGERPPTKEEMETIKARMGDIVAKVKEKMAPVIAEAKRRYVRPLVRPELARIRIRRAALSTVYPELLPLVR